MIRIIKIHLVCQRSLLLLLYLSLFLSATGQNDDKINPIQGLEKNLNDSSPAQYEIDRPAKESEIASTLDVNKAKEIKTQRIYLIIIFILMVVFGILVL